MEQIVSELESIVDDDLLESMEEMFEMALCSSVNQLQLDPMARLAPAYELLKKLRVLQKTRVRDAVRRLVGPGIEEQPKS
jgi:hypothetical protein